jgi:hypothetical protein
VYERAVSPTGIRTRAAALTERSAGSWSRAKRAKLASASTKGLAPVVGAVRRCPVVSAPRPLPGALTDTRGAGSSSGVKVIGLDRLRRDAADWALAEMGLPGDGSRSTGVEGGGANWCA